MRKYLISLDVDGTLLDNGYRSNSPTINSVIKQLTDEGHVFIINSNRSLEDILIISKMFDIPGPVIGENGCFIYYPESGKKIDLVGPEIIKMVEQINSYAKKVIEENFDRSLYAICDTTDVNKHLDVQDVPSDKINVFFLNEYRKYSISIHVKKIIAEKYQKDIAKVKELWQIVNEYIQKNNLPFIAEYTDSYANLIIYPSIIDKAIAYEKLLEIYPNYLRIVIGNDHLDRPLKKQTDFFFVVNNADDSVKAVADYIANECITKGVEEILLKLDNLVK